MSATSEQLHTATRGHVQWSTVRVVLPSSVPDACWSLPPRPAGARPRRPRLGHADVVIGASHPLLREAPWAVQYGGCGVAGRRVYVSKAFVSSFNTADSFISGELISTDSIELIG